MVTSYAVQDENQNSYSLTDAVYSCVRKAAGWIGVGAAAVASTLTPATAYANQQPVKPADGYETLDNKTDDNPESGIGKVLYNGVKESDDGAPVIRRGEITDSFGNDSVDSRVWVETGGNVTESDGYFVFDVDDVTTNSFARTRAYDDLSQTLTVNFNSGNWGAFTEYYVKLSNPEGTDFAMLSVRRLTGDNALYLAQDENGPVAGIGGTTGPHTLTIIKSDGMASAMLGDELIGSMDAPSDAYAEIGANSLDGEGLTANAIEAEFNSPSISPLGDANGDGSVTPGDAQAAFDRYLSRDTCDEVSADISPDDGDGCVDASDGDGNITPGDAQRIFDLFLERQNYCP